MACDSPVPAMPPQARVTRDSIDDTLFITPDVIDLLKVPIVRQGMLA